MRADLKASVVHWLQKTLSREDGADRKTPQTDMERLSRQLRKGDVLLIEGLGRSSRIIKLLTRSKWSHAALYVGDELLKRDPSQREEIIDKHGGQADKFLIEALFGKGVVATPLEKYRNYNLRISRPANISKAELNGVLENVVNDLGKRYDWKNILALALQFLPLSFGPFKKKSADVCIGACNEFEVMCSGTIAKAFQSVGHSIRPVYDPSVGRPHRRFRMRHPSWITPRDFDLSPYFEIINISEERSCPPFERETPASCQDHRVRGAA